jgi:hypothetical protein
VWKSVLSLNLGMSWLMAAVNRSTILLNIDITFGCVIFRARPLRRSDQCMVCRMLIWKRHFYAYCSELSGKDNLIMFCSV